MFGAWFIGRSALRAARNRNITPHGPQYVKPYRGAHKSAYNEARVVITIICLIPMALLLITLCLAK